VLHPDGAQIVAADALSSDLLTHLTAPRPPLAGIAQARPRVMGVLNVTPDSSSDGGRFGTAEAAAAQVEAMAVPT